MKDTFRLLLSSLALCNMAIAAQTNAHQAPTPGASCADPTLTTTFDLIFSPTRTAHNVRSKIEIMAFYNSAVGTADNFQYQGPAFRAWTSAQPSTVPFYQITSGDASGGDVFVELGSANGTAPVPPAGFRVDGIAGYVYATQVCGSVPLYAAANAGTSDHYWTTNKADHSYLLTWNGWVDDGIPFYVLPSDCCSCAA